MMIVPLKLTKSEKRNLKRTVMSIMDSLLDYVNHITLLCVHLDLPRCPVALNIHQFLTR